MKFSLVGKQAKGKKNSLLCMPAKETPRGEWVSHCLQEHLQNSVKESIPELMLLKCS